MKRLELILNLRKKRNLPFLAYCGLGIILFFILVIIFNTYVIHLKVETAVVSVPIETISAPVSGFIEQLFVAPGNQVQKGSPLVKLENIEIERYLQIARIEKEESQLNVDYYQNLLSNEIQRVTIYKNIGSNRVTSAAAMANVAKQELSSALKNMNRLKKLYNKHYLSEANWDVALNNYYNAKDKMKSTLAQMNLENNSLNSVEAGMYFTGNKIEGSSNDLKVEIDAAKKRLRINESKVQFYEKILAKLTLLAPFDGKVTQILKSVGNTVDNAKPILLIEQTNTNKKIIAYLTQEEILHLNSRRKVKIYIPSLGKVYQGTIININRTDGFIDEVKAQYQWRNINFDRTATVTIDVSKKDEVSFNREIFAGMPAIIYFPRKFTFF